MVKLSYCLNSLALVLSLFIAWTHFSQKAENEFLRGELSDMKSQIEQMELAVKEAKMGQIDKLNREKRKNSELEEASNAMADEITDLERKRDEVKINSEVAATTESELSAEIQASKLSIAGVDAEIRTAEQNVRNLTLSIPSLQQEIVNLENLITEQGQRKFQLENTLKTYEKETNILKEHYDCTVTALKKDFYEHPWLERGERVSVSSSDLDLESGILMLSVGKREGIEKKMLFSVRSKGKNICQIRIKEVAYDHCVAMIIPLMGTPKDLEEINNFDLIYL